MWLDRDAGASNSLDEAGHKHEKSLRRICYSGAGRSNAVCYSRKTVVPDISHKTSVGGSNPHRSGVGKPFIFVRLSARGLKGLACSPLHRF